MISSTSSLRDLRYQAAQYASGHLPAAPPAPGKKPIKSALARPNQHQVSERQSAPPTTRSYTSAISQANAADKARTSAAAAEPIDAAGFSRLEATHTIRAHTSATPTVNAGYASADHQGHGQYSRPPSTHHHVASPGDSYRDEASDFYDSGSEYSDGSGCSTCSGASGRRRSSGHHSSASHSRPSHSHSHAHAHRYTPQSHRTSLTGAYTSEEDGMDHVDCVSCTSSCSCTSGCDSQEEHEPEEEERRAHTGADAARRQAHRNSRRLSHGRASPTTSKSAAASKAASQAPSKSPSRAASRYGSAIQSKVASQVNTQRDGGSPLLYEDVEMSAAESPVSRGSGGLPSRMQAAKEAMLLSGGNDSARWAVTEENSDEHWAVTEETQTVASGRQKAADARLAEALGLDAQGQRASMAVRETAALQRAEADNHLHVTFMTPRDGVKGDGVGDAVMQRQDVYESALACITRSEKGFRCYVLTSDHATASEMNGGEVPPTVLLRRLIRYEPRRSSHRPSASRRGTTADLSASGSGTLAWYDLVLVSGGNRPQKFKLCASEREEVARIKRVEQHGEDEERDAAAAASGGDDSLSADHYTRLLQERKGLDLTIERKAGLIPIRRIREMRAGVISTSIGGVPTGGGAGGGTAAATLVRRVNDRFDELNIAEEDTIVEDHCVSLLIDSGVRSKHKHAHTHSSAAIAHQHHHGACGVGSHSAGAHDAKHSACISQYDPSVCPRVPSSFERARTGQGVRVQKEIRRNQRKLMGTNTKKHHRQAWGANTMTTNAAGASGGHIDPLNASSVVHASFSSSLNSSYLHASHQSTSSQHPSLGHSSSPSPLPFSASTSSSASSWVVICTNSREEASTLLNALMVLKVIAGKNVETKEQQQQQRAQHQQQHQEKKEKVHLPPMGSPLRKKSKHGHDQPSAAPLLQPMQLTSALMSAAQHVAAAELQVTAGTTPASSAQSSQRSFLKRKTIPPAAVAAPPAGPAAAVQPKRKPSPTPAERLSRTWQEAKVASQFAPVGSPQRAKETGAKEAKERQEQQRLEQQQFQSHEAEMKYMPMAAEAEEEATTMEETMEMIDQTLEAPSSTQGGLTATAIFIPTQFTSVAPASTTAAGGAHTPAQSTQRSVRSNTHSLTGLSTNPTITTHSGSPAGGASLGAPQSSPAHSVGDWLAKKAAASDRARRRKLEEAEQKRVEDERKKAESDQAVRKWQEKQEKQEHDKLAQERAAKAAARARAAEKQRETAARKEACLKAYTKFLARSSESRLKSLQSAKAKEAHDTQEQRRKKLEARRRFDEWVRAKSDWFLARLRTIKQRAARRKTMADGEMDEEDPEEEAALDWKWLEKEVEVELRQASEGHRQGATKPTKGMAATDASAAASTSAGPQQYRLGDSADGTDGEPRVAFSGLTESELLAEQSRARSQDANLLYSVLDEVDVELWTKLMNGLEESRERLQSIKTDHPTSPLARALERADRERGHAPVRVTSPMPLVSLQSPTAAAAAGSREPTTTTTWGGGPVRSVGLYQENVQLGGAAWPHGHSFGSGSGGPSSAAAAARPSPFSAAAVAAEEALIRDRTQLRGLFSGPAPSPPPSHQAQAPRATPTAPPLPNAARAPYQQWLREELHQVIAQEDHRSSAGPMHHSARSAYDDDYRVPSMAQRYPVAAAVVSSHRQQQALESSMASSSTAFSSSFLGSHTGNLDEVLRSGIKDVRLR